MKSLYLFCLVLFSFGGVAQTVPSTHDPLPETPKGRLVRQYLDAFNSGEDAVRHFWRDISPSDVPVEQRVERYKKFRADMGTLTPISAQDVQEGLEVLVQSSIAGKLEMTFAVSEDPNPVLNGLRVEQTLDKGSVQQVAQVPIPEDVALNEIQHLVQDRATRDEFSGTILIARGEHVLWESAFGLADENLKISNKVDTRFDIGSIVKSFTRVSIAQLIEQGKLRLTDTLGQYLPEYPNPDARAKVTVEELLDMRSGLGDFFGPTFESASRGNIRTLADYLPFFQSKPLAFEPGSKQAYSNGGYIVLGLIIEKVSGQSYYDYVQEHIFKPAGMTNSDFSFSDMPHGEATGYTKIGESVNAFVVPEGKRRTNTLMMPARGSSAGSARSTARDLFLYSQALSANVLLKHETAEKLQVSGSAIGIAGGAPGLNACLESGVRSAGPSVYTVVIMSNYDPPSAEALSKEIRELLHSVK